MSWKELEGVGRSWTVGVSVVDSFEFRSIYNFFFPHFFIIFTIHTLTACSAILILCKIFFVEELSILQLQKMYLINQIGHTKPRHFVIRLRVMYFGRILLTDQNLQAHS